MSEPARIRFELLKVDDHKKPEVYVEVKHNHFKKRNLTLKKSGIEWMEPKDERGFHVSWREMWRLFGQTSPIDEVPSSAKSLSLTVLQLDVGNPVAVVNPTYAFRGGAQRQLGTLLIGEHGVKWRKWRFKTDPAVWPWQIFHKKVTTFKKGM